MAFKRVTDERIGKPKKFASEKALQRYIADLQRKQRRLLEGKTLEPRFPSAWIKGEKTLKK